jgi:hypothetical protein
MPPSKPDNDAKQELVLTPGGPRPKSSVHSVAPGERVVFDEAGRGSIASLDPVTGKTEGGNMPMSEDLVLTPGGFRSKAFVHKVEKGQGLYFAGHRALLMDLKTKGLADIPPVAGEAPALGSGWITYAYWNNGTGNSINNFVTTWTVPQDPRSNDGQTIFLFNGIQNYGANFGILQPVLQWGYSAAGGGAYWSIASWYVTTSGQAFHTDLVQVKPGQSLTGQMILTTSTPNYSYTSSFVGIAGTELPVHNIAELLWCNETLEAYSVSQCSDYPASDMTAFSDISITTTSGKVAPNWTPVNRVSDCGQHTTVVNPEEVDLYYR